MSKSLRALVSVLLGLVSALVIAAIVFPSCSSEGDHKTPAVSNLKMMGVGLLMYAGDNNDRLPLALWMDNIEPYTKNQEILHAPEIQDAHHGAYGYAFNSLLLGANQTKYPNWTPMVYESSSLARNSSDPVSSLPSPPRHENGNYVGFIDSHAKFVKTGQNPNEAGKPAPF